MLSRQPSSTIRRGGCVARGTTTTRSRWRSGRSRSTCSTQSPQTSSATASSAGCRYRSIHLIWSVQLKTNWFIHPWLCEFPGWQGTLGLRGQRHRQDRTDNDHGPRNQGKWAIVRLIVNHRGSLLRPKMNCGVGLVNCFLWVPLACLGSMAEGSRAGTSGELWKNSLPNLLHSWFWDVVGC